MCTLMGLPVPGAHSLAYCFLIFHFHLPSFLFIFFASIPFFSSSLFFFSFLFLSFSLGLSQPIYLSALPLYLNDQQEGVLLVNFLGTNEEGVGTLFNIAP